MARLDITAFDQGRSAGEGRSDMFERPALDVLPVITFTGGVQQSARIHPKAEFLKLVLDAPGRILFYNYDWAADPTGSANAVNADNGKDEYFAAGTWFVRLRDGITRCSVIVPA